MQFLSLHSTFLLVILILLEINLVISRTILPYDKSQRHLARRLISYKIGVITGTQSENQLFQA